MDLTERPPHSLSPHGLAIAGWTGLLLAGGIFMAIAWNVAAHTPLVVLDAKVATWLHQNAAEGMTNVMLAISASHGIGAVALWSLTFAFLLARVRQWYWLLTLTLAVGGGMILNVMLKEAYERARPHFDDPMVTLNTYSFPSGHTAGATVFYGVLAAYLVSRRREPGLRVAIVAVAVVAVTLVAISRMYLGAHYLSDVAAAAASSTAWLAVCLSSIHALVRHRMAKP